MARRRRRRWRPWRDVRIGIIRTALLRGLRRAGWGPYGGGAPFYRSQFELCSASRSRLSHRSAWRVSAPTSSWRSSVSGGEAKVRAGRLFEGLPSAFAVRPPCPRRPQCAALRAPCSHRALPRARAGGSTGHAGHAASTPRNHPLSRPDTSGALWPKLARALCLH